MKNCPKCGAPVDDSAIYCTTCGASLVPQMNNWYVQSNNHNKTLAAALLVVGMVFALFFVAQAFALIPYCSD